MKNNGIDTSKLYRMPWTMSDNGFSWLEPTRKCNMTCEYCYQRNDPDSQKSMEQIDMEIRAMLKLRMCDTFIIAGGEPLTHPGIVEITKKVKDYGVKPVILTNGLALTAPLLRELKQAGAYGFVFHIDSFQSRPGWNGKNENDLNCLRQKYADMLYNEGGLICGYNTTILPETLDEVPCIVEWTTKNIHKVASNVLIPVRTVNDCHDSWEYYAGAERIDISKTPYCSEKVYRNLSALDICKKIWEVHPEYQFHSFLGGTVNSDAPKWLFGTHIGSNKKIYGNLGSKTIETIQSIYHFAKGKYLSFTSPGFNRKARLFYLPLLVSDKQVRSSFKEFSFRQKLNPRTWVERLSIQNIIVMQPHDVLPNGEQDECDGCPNKTYWNGRLISECRKEDFLMHGKPIRLGK